MKITKEILAVSTIIVFCFGFLLASAVPVYAQVFNPKNQNTDTDTGLPSRDARAGLPEGTREAAKVAKNGLVACEGAADCSFDKLLETINNVVNFIIVLATAIATIIFAWAGFLYLTAAGNSSKISQAHGMIWSAVIGFLIALSAGLIVKVILDTLGYKF